MNEQSLNDLPQPISRQDKYFAYLVGDVTDLSSLPKPVSRADIYLRRLCEQGVGGAVSEETVKQIVEDYHKENPDLNVISSDEITELLTDIF